MGVEFINRKQCATMVFGSFVLPNHNMYESHHEGEVGVLTFAATKFMRAYGFMEMTDLFGELPYTEVLGESCCSKYDTGKTILWDVSLNWRNNRAVQKEQTEETVLYL